MRNDVLNTMAFAGGLYLVWIKSYKQKLSKRNRDRFTLGDFGLKYS